MKATVAGAAAVLRVLGAAAARDLVQLIQFYRQLVSPLRPATCRFVPTCSQYAVDALTGYGLIRGSWLTMVRLAKCGPWHQGGWDPIPERRVVPTDAGVTPAKLGESESVV